MRPLNGERLLKGGPLKRVMTVLYIFYFLKTQKRDLSQLKNPNWIEVYVYKTSEWVIKLRNIMNAVQ